MSSAKLFTTSKVFTATYGQAISTILSVPAAAPSTTKAPSASILDAPHHSPAEFNPADPIVLFCIQAGIIIILTRILAIGLKKLNQPKVISEVIGGIILFVVLCAQFKLLTNTTEDQQQWVASLISQQTSFQLNQSLTFLS